MKLCIVIFYDANIKCHYNNHNFGFWFYTEPKSNRAAKQQHRIVGKRTVVGMASMVIANVNISVYGI